MNKTRGNSAVKKRSLGKTGEKTPSYKRSSDYKQPERWGDGPNCEAFRAVSQACCGRRVGT